MASTCCFDYCSRHSCLWLHKSRWTNHLWFHNSRSIAHGNKSSISYHTHLYIHNTSLTCGLLRVQKCTKYAKYTLHECNWELHFFISYLPEHYKESLEILFMSSSVFKVMCHVGRMVGRQCKGRDFGCLSLVLSSAPLRRRSSVSCTHLLIGLSF